MGLKLTLSARLTRLAIVALSLLLAAGCTTQKAWEYRPNSYSGPAQQAKISAVVLPFEDRREPSSDCFFWSLLPLIPYSSCDVHRPPLMSGLSRPTDDFAQALAHELQATGRFTSTDFAFRNEHADVVFNGSIINTDEHVTMITYGLGALGVLLWPLGLPVGPVDIELSVRLACTGRNGANLFDQTYSATPYHHLTWIGDPKEGRDFNFAGMLSQVYLEFVNDAVMSGKCVPAAAAASSPAAPVPADSHDQPSEGVR